VCTFLGVCGGFVFCFGLFFGVCLVVVVVVDAFFQHCCSLCQIVCEYEID
jgi:hypothetical protein